MREHQEFVHSEPDLIHLNDIRCDQIVDATDLKINTLKRKAAKRPESPLVQTGLFRLFVKNGEYVYARSENIIMIESCDHLVKVHLGIDGKSRVTIRHDSLKDFLSQLPQDRFMRIGRFCAINTQRLSGGNYNKQAFEFDYTISIRPKHSIPHTIFTSIGI